VDELPTETLPCWTMAENKMDYTLQQPKNNRMNEKQLTATLVWKHVDDPEANSVKGLGNVQRLPDGSTLVNYAQAIIPWFFSIYTIRWEKMYLR